MWGWGRGGRGGRGGQRHFLWGGVRFREVAGGGCVRRVEGFAQHLVGGLVHGGEGVALDILALGEEKGPVGLGCILHLDVLRACGAVGVRIQVWLSSLSLQLFCI